MISIIPIHFLIDKNQNVTTTYAIDTSGFMAEIYTIHFFSATKLWQIDSIYVKLELNKDFFSFEEIQSLENQIREHIFIHLEQIEIDVRNSVVNLNKR